MWSPVLYLALHISWYNYILHLHVFLYGEWCFSCSCLRRCCLMLVFLTFLRVTSHFSQNKFLSKSLIFCEMFFLRTPTIFFFLFWHFYFPASGQAVVTSVVPSSPRFLPSIFIAHRVQQSRCSLIWHREWLTHALAFSASQFVHKKESPRIYTSMHSGGFKLTKLPYARLEDNLIRHRGDRLDHGIDWRVTFS